MFEIAFRDDDKSGSLAMLPNKFRKMIWVKTRDFVIVEGYDEERPVLESESATEAQLVAGAGAGAGVGADTGADAGAIAGAGAETQVESSAALKDKSPAPQASSKIQYAIKHILTREQIKHLRKTGLWPEGLQAESLGHPVAGVDSAGPGAQQSEGASAAAAAAASSGRDRNRQAMPDLPPRSDDYGRGFGYGAYGGDARGEEETDEYEEEEEEIFYDKMGNTITREAAEALAAKSSTAAGVGEGGK
jgi:hypothetical protein